MMRYIFTKDEEWLNRWDGFVATNPKASHLMYSDWLQSYKSYGFDFEVMLLLNDDVIVGGCGVVIPKLSIFKFYIVPHGPIYNDGNEKNFNEFLIQLKTRAKVLKCCYAQFSVPVSTDGTILKQSYLPDQVDLKDTGFKPGKLFNYVYCSYGTNWLDFKDINVEQDLLEQLNSHGRGNIKTAYRNNLILTKAKSEQDIKAAYELVELNAQNSGYTTRAYDEVKESLAQLISKDLGVFLVAHCGNEIKGSAFCIKNANSLTYIFGGTLKEKPDLKIGYFLHWEAIKIALKNNYLGYNISMGGSKGVLRFKSQFNAQELFYDSPHHFIVLNKPIFSMFEVSEKHLKKYKKNVSVLLSKFNRN